MTETTPAWPQVGLLGLTLELYEGLSPGLRPGREDWVCRKVLPALAPFADVRFGGAVCRRDEVEAAVSAFEADGADALLVMLLTYSPSQVSLPALRRTQLPIIVWNTQELQSVDEGFDGAAMVDNHGVHGTQDLCNVLLRSGVPFRYVTSHLSDPDGTAELRDFFAAAAAVRRLRRARLGLLGYPFPGMGDFALDTTHMAATLGCEWSILPMEDYIAGAENADPDEVRALVAEYRDAYAVADDVTEADLEATARVEVALRGMVRQGGLDGFTYQFMAFGQDERTPTVPFVAASRLMAEGLGFGGEGDLIAAAGSALLQWLWPPASFTEMFTIDFGGNAVLLSHMGEANVAMARADRKVPMVARDRPITRTRGRQLALVTSFEPGPATLCALTQGPGGGWRLVATAGRIADYGPLPAMRVPHARLVVGGDVRDFLTAYARAGGPHHAAVCFGDALRRLRMAADLLGAGFFEV
jgi:L-arabinose isomerase